MDVDIFTLDLNTTIWYIFIWSELNYEKTNSFPSKRIIDITSRSFRANEPMY